MQLLHTTDCLLQRGSWHIGTKLCKGAYHDRLVRANLMASCLSHHLSLREPATSHKQGIARSDTLFLRQATTGTETATESQPETVTEQRQQQQQLFHRKLQATSTWSA